MDQAETLRRLMGENKGSANESEISCLVRVSPDSRSLREVLGFICHTMKEHRIYRFGVIVNFVTSFEESKMVFYKLQKVASHFPNAKLEFLGHAPGEVSFNQIIQSEEIELKLSEIGWLVKSSSNIFQRLKKHGESVDKRGKILNPLEDQFWKTLMDEVSP